MSAARVYWGGGLLLGVVAAGAIITSTGGRGHAAEETTATPKDAVVRFSHTLHQDKGLDVGACKICHSMKGLDLAPATSGMNHQPCNNKDCHASEYMAKEPKICVVCHESNEPWVKQPARIRKLGSSEFGGEISHKTHQSDKVRKGGLSCSSCHGDLYKDGDKPETHAVCGSCHQSEQAPVMTDCGGCHKLGYQVAQRKGDSRYTVRALFKHPGHAVDPRNTLKQPPACSTCHFGVEAASTLAEVPSPTMRSCSACHDGTYAFKTTGFGCVKCHGAASP